MKSKLALPLLHCCLSENFTPICHLINLVLTSGYVPATLKIVAVIIIIEHPSPDSSAMEYFRPT